MPTRNVNLTGELDRFVAASIESGRYANASEVVRSALRMLEREEREYEEKLAALRKAIDEGLESGVAEPGVFERLFDYIDQVDAEDAEKDKHVA
jgi:antitoxin ParD1/3/4